MIKTRIKGTIESDMVNYSPKFPFSFTKMDCVIRTLEDGKKYKKYVEFDFSVHVKDMKEAMNLRTFLEAFMGASDGGFSVDIDNVNKSVSSYSPEFVSIPLLPEYETDYFNKDNISRININMGGVTIYSKNGGEYQIDVGGDHGATWDDIGKLLNELNIEN